MGRSHHLNDLILDMTNTGKALIVGLVLLDLGFVSYLMIPKDDEQSKKAPEAELTQSAVKAGVDTRFDDTHVTEGSVIRTPQSTTAAGKIASAGKTAQASQPPKQPQVVQQAPATAAPEVRETFAAKPVPAPQQQAAVATAPAQVREAFAANPIQAPQPQMPPPQQRPQSAPATAPAQARASFAAKPVPAQQYARARDDLNRHGSNPVAAALTQQLVSESAKPDPSLPMPTMPLTPPVRTAPDYQDRHGANPTAAAMTQQLVRESAKPDPSLPMPPAVQSPPIYQDSHGSNSVAAAMTQELVRKSAGVNPTSQPVPHSGTQ